MCGRFAQFSPLKILKQKFEIESVSFDFRPSYNIAPTHEVITVVNQNAKNHLEKQHWGLVPNWAKDISIGYNMINARSETIATKPAFRNAFKKQRCLIIADGFYEWKGEKGRKQPYFITTVSGEPFAFAGLWDSWKKNKSDEQNVYKSCTIITKAASESLSALHDRMPAILIPEYRKLWLDPEIQSIKDLEDILCDTIINDIKYYQVSKLVNSVKNNDPLCIEPLNKIL